MQFFTFLTLLVAIYLFEQTYAFDCDETPDLNEASDCCNIPKLVNKVFHEECATELGGPSNTGFNLTRECIMTECIFNKYGVINEGGVVDVTAIKSGVKNKLESYAGWQIVFNEAADKCVAESVAKHDELIENFDEFKNCNPSYAYIVTCIGEHLMVECPEADRNGDAVICDNLRAYLKECPAQFPPKFIH